MANKKIKHTLWIKNETKIALALARTVLQPGINQPVTFKKQADLDTAYFLKEQGAISIDEDVVAEEVEDTEEVITPAEPVTLTKEEIEGMGKKDLLKFLKDNAIELEGVHSRTKEQEVKDAVLIHFGFEVTPADAE
jgi:hypothetical protein